MLRLIVPCPSHEARPAILGAQSDARGRLESRLHQSRPCRWKARGAAVGAMEEVLTGHEIVGQHECMDAIGDDWSERSARGPKLQR